MPKHSSSNNKKRSLKFLYIQTLLFKDNQKTASGEFKLCFKKRQKYTDKYILEIGPVPIQQSKSYIKQNLKMTNDYSHVKETVISYTVYTIKHT